MTRFDAGGPDLQTAMFRAGELPDESEVEAVCARLRDALADRDRIE
ncbi:hypothetical protein [Actinoallomurus sp. NPDC050550]